MIYVSSSCVKSERINDSVEKLAINGFTHIELSGGTEYYENFESDLLELKDKYNLNYRCHNYFPPPKKPFVLNLASLNNDIFQMSFEHLKKSIALSDRLGAKKFAFHAGFFIDIKLKEIGKKLNRDDLFNKKESVDRFCRAYREISKQVSNVSLYIENNVFSSTNAKTYTGKNPFMMTNFREYQSLREKIDFNLLLDVAHLKVSAETLGLDWKVEFKKMINVSDYIHISDNDGLHDLNHQLTNNSELISMLKQVNTQDKDFTLEVYDRISAIKKSYNILFETVLV
jgi:sugar phosphate isomerase/epimerase